MNSKEEKGITSEQQEEILKKAWDRVNSLEFLQEVHSKGIEFLTLIFKFHRVNDPYRSKDPLEIAVEDVVKVELIIETMACALASLIVSDSSGNGVLPDEAVEAGVKRFNSQLKKWIGLHSQAGTSRSFNVSEH